MAAIDMRIHNIDIFVGKWKKGAKAWSGEFVARELRESLAALNVLEPEADRSLRGAALRLVAAVNAEGNIDGNCDRDILMMAKNVLSAIRSETAALTIEDKRWRFLEHGCQWVSWTPIGGETVSFDPRDVKYLQAMRDQADKTLHEHMAQLRAEAHALKRRLK